MSHRDELPLIPRRKLSRNQAIDILDMEQNNPTTTNPAQQTLMDKNNDIDTARRTEKQFNIGRQQDNIVSSLLDLNRKRSFKKEKISRSKSSPRLGTRYWCSLPTIAEHYILGKGNACGLLDAKSCHTLLLQPQNNSSRNSRFRKSQDATICYRNSAFVMEDKLSPNSVVPSQNITLKLLRDLNLSTTTKKALSSSINGHARPTQKSSAAKRSQRIDRLPAPPLRVSSDASLDEPLSSPNSTLQTTNGRFDEILQSNPQIMGAKVEGVDINVNLRRQDLKMKLPTLPKRAASPPRGCISTEDSQNSL
jgi:hypothetical protein